MTPTRADVLETAVQEIREAWDAAEFPIRCPSPEYKRIQDALREVEAWYREEERIQDA